MLVDAPIPFVARHEFCRPTGGGLRRICCTEGLASLLERLEGEGVGGQTSQAWPMLRVRQASKLVQPGVGSADETILLLQRVARHAHAVLLTMSHVEGVYTASW